MVYLAVEDFEVGVLGDVAIVDLHAGEDDCTVGDVFSCQPGILVVEFKVIYAWK